MNKELLKKACERGETETVAMLLDNGANPNYNTTNESEYPLIHCKNYQIKLKDNKISVLSHGPLSDRRCTDIICLLSFIAFLFGMILLLDLM